MSVKAIFVILIVIVIASMAATVTAWSFYVASQTVIQDAHRARFDSYLLADELRQSSDDLTRLARTYVVTGTAVYEQQYMDILDIRNGKKPRPQQYNRIYWDFVVATGIKPRLDGETVSLQDLMRKTGFTETEFSKLRQAQANSDGLVKLEVVAMNAVKGLFDDGKGNFTVKKEPDMMMARDLLHSKQYHEFKAQIMAPIDEFFTLLDARTVAAVKAAEERTSLLGILMLVPVLVAMVSVAVLALMMYRRIIRPILMLKDTMIVLAGGDMHVEIPLQDRSDEVGDLARAAQTFKTNADRMAEAAMQITRVATAAGQVSQAVSQVSDGSATQLATIRRVATGAEETAGAIAGVVTNTRGASEIVRGAAGLALDGQNRMGRVVEMVHGLAENSKKISAIADIIGRIAAQTNMLSLNAAIEAARAGEHGKGFAVVAEEVRKLADSTSGSAGEIAVLVGHAASETERGVSLVTEANTFMSEILGRVQQSDQIMQRISEAIAEQSTSAETMKANLVELGRIGAGNAAAAEEITATMVELSRLAEDTRSRIEAFHIG